MRNKIFYLFSILVLSCGILSYCVGDSVPSIYSQDGQKHKVVRVVDGDTVKIDYFGEITTVRLVGVDTPETVHPRKDVEYYGPEASMFLKNLLVGEYVCFIPDSKSSEKDRYGRLLGYLLRYPDGLFVNLEIVRQGYGKAYTRFDFDYEDMFVKYESIAKESKKGLWK